MSSSIVIDRISKGKFTLIAEIGVNYYDIANKLGISPMEAAKYMILSAKNAGIHAVKFQTYKADQLASKHSPSYWDTNEEPSISQYKLFKKFDSFEEKEYEELSRFCQTIGIEFLSTPFDFSSADYLDSLMSIFKISSSDINNLPFIAHIAKKGKPIFLSTGASYQSEIEDALRTIRQYNSREVGLLHCVLEYPTPYEDANLEKIVELGHKFPDVYVGYSDHTKPDVSYDVIKTAYLFGAVFVEKHFTLDKSLKGNDHYHAMDAYDARNILSGIEFLELLRGNGSLVCLKNESISRKNARRSIVAVVDIPKGTKIAREMITFKRPGTGLSPGEVKDIAGKTAIIDIRADEIIMREMIEL